MVGLVLFRFQTKETDAKKREEAARWIDTVVALAGFEMALDGMWLAAAYSPPQTGRG